MIARLRKQNTAHRPLFLLGIPLITTLVLLIGSVVWHIPGTPLLSSAYAATAEKTMTQDHLQTPCASDPTVSHCNNQDPMAQGCNRDAQTLSYKEMPARQGGLLATVQRRYSPTCHSEWGRIIESPVEYLHDHQPLSIAIGTNESRSTPGPIAFSTMVFVPNMSVASEIRGIISINGIAPDQHGGPGLETILPALPAPQ